ncbi:MAG: rod shape-determining protein MreD [Candidatus Omnitrophota bacterium]
MKKWLIVLIIIILALLEVTLLDYIRVFGTKPDLLIISVFVLSFYAGFKWALPLAILAGALKDAFGSYPFGLNTLLFSVWSILLIKLSKKVSIDSDLIRAILVFIILVFNNIIARMILLFSGNSIPLGIFLRVTFLESLYTASVLPLVLKFIKLAV